jgi:mRNA interferase RelE/StbE
VAPYNFAYTEAALAALKALPRKAREQIRRKIDALAENPYPNGSKQLHNAMDGGSHVHRIRSGDYRILYCIRDIMVIAVLDIGDRKNVYRRR